MGITSRQLAAVRRIERLAMRHDYLPIRKRQAELWALAHVGDDWYKLKLMLMSRGCNLDYSDFTEIAPDSVYELDDTGCYVVMADWWTDYRLCQRDWWWRARVPSLRDSPASPKCSQHLRAGLRKYRPATPDLRSAEAAALTEKIELYNPGEYCEDVESPQRRSRRGPRQHGETCLDRNSNAPCNPCLRRIDNMNHR